MKSYIQKIENYKNFDEELELINFIESFKETPITIQNAPNRICRLTKQDNALELEADGELPKTKPHPDNESSCIQISVGEREFTICSYDFKSSSTAIDDNRVNVHYVYSVKQLSSEAFSKQSTSKFRAFFPVSIELLKTFHDQFETVTYQDNRAEYAYECLRAQYDDEVFDIIQIKRNGKGYYVIESFCEETLDTFEDHCFAIRQALGFIGGYMPGGEQYVFSDTKSLYYTNYIRPAIKSYYRPIYRNPYGRLSEESTIAEQYDGKLAPISLITFSNLVKRIKNNAEYSAIVMLLQDSANARSLLLMPSIFSVILESLSKIISQPEEGKVYPIIDTAVKTLVIDNLTAVIDKFSSDIGEKGVSLLKRRIADINKPVNKTRFTNLEKLLQPFEQLEIKLTRHDLSILKHRNDLLHGNILLSKDNDLRSLEEINNYAAYVSGKLFTLITKLILKSVGYNGYVYNHAKFYERYLGVSTEDEYYETV